MTAAAHGGSGVAPLLRAIAGDLIGAGPLAGLLADPTVTDILVNGPHEVWVDRGFGLQPTGLRFDSDDAVHRFAVRLAGSAGRRLDTAVPFVDARLSGGVRLHAVIPPVAVSGACLSLRIHGRRELPLSRLVELGSLPPALAEVLEAMVGARLAFLISGGAGTGKTTLLGALLGRSDRSERLVVVEDAAELVVDHPHVIRLEARQSNVEGAGEITLRDLVRQALRMRPDRLILGEVRGPELLDMLLAANTGHEGTVTTLHANGVMDVPARVEALAMLAGIDRPSAHSLLAAALGAAVHLRRAPHGARHVAEIAVLQRGCDAPGDDLVRAVPALRWAGGSAEVATGPGAEALGRLLHSRDGQVPACLRQR